MSEQTFTVGEADAGLRLDRFLAAATGASRHRIVAAIESGGVRVNGRRARKGQALEPGQVVLLHLEPLAPQPQPELPLVVVHEDPAFVVVEKPAGWPTHPLLPGETGTLANAVVARFPECAAASESEREGGACHRLDGPTSGLVLFARTREDWEALRAQFGARTVEKQYLALAAGSVFGPAELTAPLEPAGPGRMRVAREPDAVEAGEAREAFTLVEVEKRGAGWTLVRCTITTGVMHQIRVHLAHEGTPVAGDDLYGGDRPPGLQRMFLHASVLGFDHPRTGDRVRFTSALPPELAGVLDALAL
jgi:23S rRNA pseudouridine1911/1915/1917 synthase